MRARGEGTIYHDQARNRWIGAVTIAGRRRKVSGRDKTEARAKLAELLAAKTTGTPVADKQITVGQVLATFLKRGVPNRTSNGQPLAPSTLDTYRWTAELIDSEIGRVRVAELGVDDVEAMLDRLARRKVKPLGAASLRKVRGTLSRALDFAERRGEVQRNVAGKAEITPTATKKRGRVSLSPVEARALLDGLRAERNGAMFAMSLRLGLRPGEAAGLYWEDLHGDVVNITRGVRSKGSRAEVVDDLKVESARRTIELPPELIEWLAEHRAAQVAERLAAGSWADDRLMFASTRGTVLLPRNVRRQLDDICQRVGITRVRPNELRHSCASLLSDIGVPNELIADLLGHTTTRMVDSTYRHRLRPVVDVAARSDWTEAR